MDKIAQQAKHAKPLAQPKAAASKKRVAVESISKIYRQHGTLVAWYVLIPHGQAYRYKWLPIRVLEHRPSDGKDTMSVLQTALMKLRDQIYGPQTVLRYVQTKYYFGKIFVVTAKLFQPSKPSSSGQ